LKKLEKHNLKKVEYQNIVKKIEELKIIELKEIKLNEKLKSDNKDIVLNEKEIYDELEENIKMYKEICFMDFERTEDGFLKIIFHHLNKNNIDSFVKLHVKNESFDILEIFPKIEYKDIQELQNMTNLNTLLVKIVENFINYFDNKK